MWSSQIYTGFKEPIYGPKLIPDYPKLSLVKFNGYTGGNNKGRRREGQNSTFGPVGRAVTVVTLET